MPREQLLGEIPMLHRSDASPIAQPHKGTGAATQNRGFPTQPARDPTLRLPRSSGQGEIGTAEGLVST